MCVVGFSKSCIEQAVGGEWDVKDLIDRTEEHAAIQLVVSTWLRNRGDGK
jgi:hypothetical protein